MKNNKKQPNFMVVGAQRCGTTWLYENLRRHPDIFLPEVKELSFFTSTDYTWSRSRWGKGEQWYLGNFEAANNENCIGDVTPEYLVDPHAPKRIFDLLGQIRIICIVRDPIERAFSNYKRALREQEYTASFSNFMENDIDLAVTRGIYAPQLKRYISQFGEENVLILSYDDIAEAPRELLINIYNFLNINNEYASPLSDVSFNIGSSSNSVVKKVVYLRNLLYKLPLGKKIIKTIQRSKVGNLLMKKFLQKQAVKEEGMKFHVYHSLFTEDIKQLHDSLGLSFVSNWKVK